MIITIDGPAGSGKSTVAKVLAEKLNFYYLYTGLLYRAVAYILITKLGKNVSDLEKPFPKNLEFISEISYEYKNKEPHIFFYGEDLTDYLYDTSLDQPASIISTKKKIRDSLLNLQRSIAQKYDIVAEGRDCGSVIFPNANYKFFLTANIDIRVERIFKDEGRGKPGITLQKVKAELEKRDKRDRERKVAPLIVPKDAIIIDNSKMSEEETVQTFLSFIQVKE